MRHHAIIITSQNSESISMAHVKALVMFTQLKYMCGMKCEIVSPVLKTINRVHTFIIAPDGSKEGWEESEVGNIQRDKYIEWLKNQIDEDGSSSLDWIVIQYGDDDNETKVINSSDDEYIKFKKKGANHA